MASKSLDMTKGNLWKQIFVFSLPLMLSNFLQVLFNLSDIIVVGQFGKKNSIGAVGSTSILISLFTGIMIGMGNAVNVVVAKAIGQKNEEKIHITIHNGILLCFIIGLLFGILGISLSYPLLSILGTKEEVFSDAQLYFCVYLIGMPGVALYNYGNAIYSALGDTKRPLIYLAIAGALNIGLNMFFVAVCQLDVLGVALASSISQYLSMSLILISLFRRNDEFKLKFKEIKPNKQDTLELLKIGVPASLQNAIFAIANLFIQGSVNTFDIVMVNGNSAASNYDALVYDVMAAFYYAGSSFIGQNFGAGKKKRILHTYFISVVYSLGVGLIIGLFLELGGRPALALFTTDEATISAGMQRLRIMGYSYFVSALMDSAIAASRGLGKTFLPMVLEIFGVCVFRIVWVYTIFAYFHTIESLYLLYLGSWILSAVMEIPCFIYYYKKLTKDMVNE
jgi:putative MATE family efflux protein